MNREKQIFQAYNTYMHTVLQIIEKMQNSGEFRLVTALSHSALSVLMCIPKEESRNYKDITEALHIPKSTLTGIARQLENQGYIKQKINEQDRRRRDLYLTEKGIAAQKEHDLCEEKVYILLTGKLSLDEKELLLKLMSKSL